MRTILILCFVAVISAGELGYAYQTSGVLGDLNPEIGLNGFGGPLGLFNSGNELRTLNTLGPVSDLGAGGFGSANLLGSTGLNLGLNSGLSSGTVGTLGNGLNAELQSGLSGILKDGLTGDVTPQFHKEYFYHSAPEEEFNEFTTLPQIPTRIKKNLRVIFIKTPENNGYLKHALHGVHQLAEDRTAIYVLVKQPDISELHRQIQQVQELHPSKPEVRFIKYRSSQDAANAQQAIQAQYDALGGSSTSSDEGIAPVLNYASPIGSGSDTVNSSVELQPLAAPASVSPTQSTYLPPTA